jgi:hypothetical protein
MVPMQSTSAKKLPYAILGFLLAIPFGMTLAAAEEEVHCTDIEAVQGELYTTGFPQFRTKVWYRFVFEYNCSDGVAHTVGAQTEGDCETGYWYSNIDILSCTEPATSSATGCVAVSKKGEFQYSSGAPYYHWLHLEVHGCNNGGLSCHYLTGGNPYGDIKQVCKLIEN